MKRNCLTVEQLLAVINTNLANKTLSPDSTVILSLTDSGIENANIQSAAVVENEPNEPGYLEIRCLHDLKNFY